MVQIKKKGFLLLLSFLFCSLVLIVSASGKESTKGTQFGDLFPRHTFPPLTSTEDQIYLGLSEGKPFTLGEVRADLIVIELLNIYCTSCQKQAPIYNEVFDLVKKDPAMKGKVK